MKNKRFITVMIELDEIHEYTTDEEQEKPSKSIVRR